MEYVEARVWSENHQREHGDCLDRGYVCILPQRVHLDLRQNDISELKGIWGQMGEEMQRNIISRYGQIASLLFIEVDLNLIRAAIQFWDPSYRCFSFNNSDMTPTIEEYTALLRCNPQHPDRVYARAQGTPSAKKRLAMLLGTRAEHLQQHFRKKNGRDCVTLDFLNEFIITHLNDQYGVIAFVLAVYGSVIFPHTLGYIDMSVIDLVAELQFRVDPVPAILAETIRSLNHCRKEGEGRFIACLPLLYVWLRTHLEPDQKGFKAHYLIRDPIRDFSRLTWRQIPSKEEWVRILRSISADHIRWRVPWLSHTQILFRCGNYHWVPLLGIFWGTTYCPLLVIRQFGGNQFIPATRGLKDLDYGYWTTGERVDTGRILEAWGYPIRMIAGQQNWGITETYDAWRTLVARDLNPQLEAIIEPVLVPANVPAISEADTVWQELESQKKGPGNKKGLDWNQRMPI